MLKNAYLYEDIIKQKMYECWYDERFQYYFMGPYHDDFALRHDDGGDWYCRTFASLDSTGKVIGMIGYKIDHEVGSATNFGAINFYEDAGSKLTFGRDICQAIDDIFCKFGMNRVEFNVVCGNPIEKSYDRMATEYGGRILCIRHDVAKDMAGNLHDDKAYEIMRRDYLKAKESKHPKGFVKVANSLGK